MAKGPTDPSPSARDRRPTEWQSRRRLLTNTSWNIAGQALPLVAAIVAIPILIDSLGTARFGVLSLAWALVGYLTVFDFGLGRAVTREVIQILDEDRSQASGVVWTAVAAIFGLSCLGAALLAVITPFLVDDALQLPASLGEEARTTFYLVAAALPFVISTTALRGVLEAQGRFDLVNFVRAPTGIWTFAGPLLVLPFSNTLPPVVAMVVAARLVTWLLYLLLCVRNLPELKQWRRPTAQRLRALARFGGWVSVSNLLGPALVTTDRFLLAGLVSASAVAFYATPYDAVTKLLLVPISLGSVIFPAFAAMGSSDVSTTLSLARRGVTYLTLAIFPFALVIVTFANQLLTVWISGSFADESDRVLELLTIGVLANSLTWVSYSLLQSRGRPDLTAKIHLLEVVPYLIVLVIFVNAWGVNGAAIAWAGRTAVDCLAMNWMAGRRMLSGRGWFAWTGGVAAGLFLSLLVIALLQGFARFALAAAVGISFTFLAWKVMLETTDRAWLRSRLASVAGRVSS